MIVEQRGDEAGVTEFGSGGEARNTLPQLYLFKNEGVWHCQETGLTASFWPVDHTPEFGKLMDIRSGGMAANLDSLGVGQHSINPLSGLTCDGANWTETERDNRIAVAARCPDERTIEWEIDPQLGGSIVRSTVLLRGEVVSECLIQVDQIDGVWLPVQAEYFQNGVRTQELVLTGADFAESARAAEFTLADLQAQPGTNVSIKGRPAGSRIEIWNGEEVVSVDEFHRQVAAGERQWGPLFVAARLRGGYFDSPYLTDEARADYIRNSSNADATAKLLSYRILWSDYVRKFCERYGFEPGQLERAEELRARCEKRAAEIIQRRSAEIDVVQKALAELASSPTHDDAATRREREKLAALLKPIDAVFERDLVPGLRKIPTREQAVKLAERLAETAEK